MSTATAAAPANANKAPPPPEERSVDLGLLGSSTTDICVLVYTIATRSKPAVYAFKNGAPTLGTAGAERRFFGTTTKTDDDIKKVLERGGCKEIDLACYLCGDSSVKLWEVDQLPAWVTSSLQKSLKVIKTATPPMALSACVYSSRKDYTMLTNPRHQYVVIQGKPEYIFTLKYDESVKDGELALNNQQRIFLNVGLTNEAPMVLTSYKLNQDTAISLSTLHVSIDFLSKPTGASPTIDAKKLQEFCAQSFDKMFFTIGQKFLLEYASTYLVCQVEKSLCIVSTEGAEGDVPQGKLGRLDKTTFVQFVKKEGSPMQLQGASSETKARTLLNKDWDSANFGIGGLAKEFNEIFRRAFSSRLLPPGMVAASGIPHVKGILLYGPPGTGKTLLARQIGKMLNAKEPKIVNGPEILSKYVGQSEENVRALFKDAEQEYKARGEDSDLHIIIFDEIDAICKQRGSRNDGTGVGDTVVNQMLSKIDGVDALNNILIIGMTNRKDMIDEALLRPGRLEVHCEITIPDEAGRLEIFKIHTKKINDKLDSSVDLKKLAELTKNYVGAEIQGIVKNAYSYAIDRLVDRSNLEKSRFDEKNFKVYMDDFLNAIRSYQPAFGLDKDQFENCAPHGIIDYSSDFFNIRETCAATGRQLQASQKTTLISLLVKGPHGSGKTAFASTLAMKSGFPFMKVVSPSDMVGMSESRKLSYISKIFEDAYKSPLSVVVMDDLDRLVEYVELGNQFSNMLLQAILVIVKKTPPKGNKLFIIGTVSDREVFKRMELTTVFDMQVELNILQPAEVEKVLKTIDVLSDADLAKVTKRVREENMEMSIKKLLLVTEMARAGDDSNSSSSSTTAAKKITLDQFNHCLDTYVQHVSSSSSSF